MCVFVVILSLIHPTIQYLYHDVTETGDILDYLVDVVTVTSHVISIGLLPLGWGFIVSLWGC
jgi:hypothetical protein